LLIGQLCAQVLQPAEDQPGDRLAAPAQVLAHVGQGQPLQVVQFDGNTLIFG
jgi:hypothetical protein